MADPLRWFIPNVMYEVTTRTIQERYLLAPSSGARELMLGVLGRGLALYPAVQLHAFAYLSNHGHLLLSSTDGQAFAWFLGYVNSNIAREMGRLHDWRGPFWGRRGRPIPVLDEGAAVERLRYIMSQGVKEGLVAHPADWPGATSVPALLGSMQLEGTWIDRDLETRARRAIRAASRRPFESRVVVSLAPIPPWSHLSHDDLVERHRALVAEVISQYRAMHREVLGPARAAIQDPHARPVAPARRPAPQCHASTSGVREAFRSAYRGFVNAFRRAAAVARDALTRGDKPSAALARFPPGSYPRPGWHQPVDTLAARQEPQALSLLGVTSRLTPQWAVAEGGRS